MIRKILIIALLVCAASVVASAQPDPNTAPKGANPANTGRGPQTPEEKAKAQEQLENVLRQGMEQAAAMMKMSPEQQKAMMQKMQEQSLRGEFARAGFTDKKLQDTVLEFIAEQEKARGKVRVAASKVYLALEPEGSPTTSAGMKILLNNYLAATEDARAQREAATKALDAKIGFSKKPHLMALLTLKGLIGDASWFTSDVLMLGTLSIGSLSEIVNAPPAAK